MDKLWTTISVFIGVSIAYEWGRREGKKEGRKQALDAMELYFEAVKVGMNVDQNNNNDDEKAEEESQ